MFSSKERPTYFIDLSEIEYDIVIIGGGMTGAGITLDASSRGLKTALLEKRDFGWGTSSRSTKLIHGGLRYLKQLKFGLVREVGLERNIVYQNALHIVRPVKMLLPIIKGGSLGSLGTRIGLTVYDRLADVKKSERNTMLTKKKALEMEPLLNSDVLKGGGLYVEYRTDDSRLVIENIKKASDIGANALNYCEAIAFEQIAGGKHRVTCKDVITGNEFQVTTKVLVNASGPWVDKVRSIDNPSAEKKMFLSKGTHIVVSQERFPISYPTYFDVNNDNRMIFAIPRNGIVYVGPTDTAYQQSIDKPLPEANDVQYILDATNFMFPSLQLEQADILSTWSGLRPLIHQEGKTASEMSRKDEVFDHPSGMITIAGGKLTGYRKMAEKIVDKTIERLNNQFEIAKRFPKCFTDEVKVSGSEFKSEKSLEAYRKGLLKDAKEIGLSEEWIDYLVYTYGSNTDIIIGRYQAETRANLSPTHKALKAEIWYGVDHEMVSTINDFFIRRTGRLYFNRLFTLEHVSFVADCLATELGWDERTKQKELESYRQEASEVMAF